jgi:autotransporter passenger strand-loop-strand repeat protein
MTTYTVGSGQTSSGIALNGGDTMYVLNGGVSVSATAGSGGTEILSGSGIARSTQVSSGGFLLLSGHSTTSATRVDVGGFEGAFHSGTASGGIIFGTLVVYSGGLDQLGVVGFGGTEVVSSGGSTSQVTVLGGGIEDVFGLTSDTVLSDERVAPLIYTGVENVFAGGTANATVVNGGIENLAGGTATFTTVNFGSVDVGPSGTLVSATVNSGGFVIVLPGGTATGTIKNPGGTVVSTGVVLYDPSGTAVYPNVASNVTVGSGVTEDVLPAGSTIHNTVIGTQNIFADGTASGTIVNGGGFEFVFSGGVASGTTVNSGGQQQVGAFVGPVSGTEGSASGTTINNGGVQIVEVGTANGTVVNGGGFELDYAMTNGTVVNGSPGNRGQEDGEQLRHRGPLTLWHSHRYHGEQRRQNDRRRRTLWFRYCH